MWISLKRRVGYNVQRVKIISWNVNGLRAVYKRNFLTWFKETNADIVCLQEIKASKEQLPSDLINIPDYHPYFNCAVKPGYSGVAVYTKQKPIATETKIGLKRFDEEGRVLKLIFPEFTLFNLYVPHGGRQKENLNYKLDVYDYLLNLFEKMRGERVILIGDFNVAHKEIDLARPKQNQKNIMFTQEEREQLDKFIALGFTDSFRKFHPEGGHYTWWPYFANARERNIGWRIDYAFFSKHLSTKMKEAFILPQVKGSDHCPIGLKI